MPVTAHFRAALLSGMVSACAALQAQSQSTVAQGKYYAAGQPRYDEFFVGLFLLQVEMEQAPHVPELERLNLAHSLGLTPQASTEQVGQRLHDEALKLRRSGLRMRLEQSPGGARPEVASAAVRTSERPQQAATSAWIAQVERSATRLLRSVEEMDQAAAALTHLEAAASGLDDAADQDFAAGLAGKGREVQQNLADGHELIALMKIRATSVRAESDGLLSRVAQAVDTDDGSLATPPSEAPPTTVPDASAKKPARPRPASAKAQQHAPPGTAPAEGAAPAQGSRKTTKAQPAPRDFEP